MADHDEVSTFIRLFIPTTSTLNLENIKDGSEIGKQWLSTLSPILKAPYHKRIVWGRILEEPEQVLLIVAWKKREALHKFLCSAAGGQFEEFLKTAGKDAKPADVTTLVFQTNGWYLALDNMPFGTSGFVGFNFVNFPAPVTDEGRKKIFELRGLRYQGPAHWTGGDNKLPYRWEPMMGWVEGVTDWEGHHVETFTWCHSWKDGDKEKEGKDSNTRDMGPNATVEQEWENKLRDLQAVSWREEHLHASLLSST
jgi:hypothetical protein